jgi:glycosyltransferase involved in cell wall biosynthesis
MRILFLGNIQSVHLRRWVSAAVMAGDQAAVCSFVRGECEVEVSVLRTFGFGKAAYLFCVPQLNRLVRQFRPDVVHAHYLTSYGALASLAGCHPLLVTAWGSDLLPVPTTTAFHRWAARQAVHKADIVTVVASHMTASALTLGADPDRIETVSFGVDLALFKPKTALPAHGLPRIVCTRNFDDVYRVDTLIAAVARLKNEGRRLRLHLIGDGPRRGRLQRLAKTLGVGADAAFLGSCVPSEVADELASADVFVSPSISDGNNVSLTEAMACGAFPIATDIAANRHWIESGVTGLLFPPGDAGALARALATALDSPELRHHAKRMNLEVVRQQANWDKSVAQMRDLYQRVIDDVRHARMVA